ncbi:putative leucine-rich repeat domain superfamily [Dioscorea sansibarensis]
MTSTQMVNQYLFRGFYRGLYYEDHLSVHFRNKNLLYTKTLSLVTSIDLSRNKLTGQFPDALTKLTGLLFLDLSSNNLTGGIPENISSMRSLLSLDLSNNGLSGGIPSGLTNMSSVGYLNLSNNNFSGRIPTAEERASWFTGNSYLCGPPLTLRCQETDGDNTSQHDDEDDYDNNDDETILEDKWLLLSLGIGYAVGLLGLFAVISIRKQWSSAYFNGVDQFIHWTSQLKNAMPWAAKTQRSLTRNKT